jgi:probable F420-dependent oxidoreductase
VATHPLRFGVGVPADVDRHLGGSWIDAASRWCQRAEALGFDFVTLPHHRFTAGYPSGSPWVTLAALAARTTTLRLGTAVFLLPLDHPLDVAEDVATLDQVSNGRTFVGVGLGYRRYEWDALQLPYEQRGSRMTEALEILQRALSDETVEYHGEHFDFGPITVHPRPVQRPRPAIWVGANTAPAIQRAAELGDAWIVGFGDRIDALGPTVTSYREAATASGQPGEICVLRLVGIADSRRHVEDDWLPSVLEMLRSYRRAGAPGRRDEQASTRLRQAGTTGGGSDRLEMLSGMIVAGDPDDVVAGVRRYVEATACEHFVPVLGGTDPVGALELFGRAVIPAFR